MKAAAGQDFGAPLVIEERPEPEPGPRAGADPGRGVRAVPHREIWYAEKVPARGAYSAGDHLPMKDTPTISRTDVAAFMHQAVHGGDWIHRSPMTTD